MSLRSLTLLFRSDVPLRVVARYLGNRLGRLRPAGRRASGEAAAVRRAFAESARYLNFSNTWFDASIPLWIRLLAPLKTASGGAVETLEIGSWEGRSTLFLATYFPNGRVTAVDTWAGGDEHQGLSELSEIEARFDRNLAACRERIDKRKGVSVAILTELVASRRESYHLAYIDGSHFADDVLLDAVLAWRLLRPGGIMIFDDFLWRIRRYGWQRNPAKAIGLFLRLVRGDFELLHVGDQVAIRKTASLDRYTRGGHAG